MIDYRRKLFSGSNESQACVILETLVDTKLHRGSSVTEVMFRNCARKNEYVVKKILEIRQPLLSSKERLAAHCQLSTRWKDRVKPRSIKSFAVNEKLLAGKRNCCRYRRNLFYWSHQQRSLLKLCLARKFWCVCRSCKWKFQTVRIARFCSCLRFVLVLGGVQWYWTEITRLV